MDLVETAYGATDLGGRPHNEDNYLVDRDMHLYAVADGMGGHLRGEVASALACRVLQEQVAARRELIEAHRAAPTEESGRALSLMLQEAFIRACEEIYQASLALDSGHGGRMGTTLDAVLVVGAVAFTAHVGDGRIYLWRGEQLNRITVDHSLVQEQIEAGALTPEQARRSRFRHVITRALGPFSSVAVDALQVDLVPGDRLLLCTDGAYGRQEDAQINAILMESTRPGAADAIVNEAVRRGTRDNVTALVVQVDSPGTAPDPAVLQAPAERVEALRHCDLFTECTYREIVQVANACTVRDYASGETIFRSGEPGRECYVVVHGEVDIWRESQTLARIRQYGFFGELSFLDDPHRSASAVAVDDTRLLVFSRRAFLAMLRQESGLANKLLWRLLIRMSQVVRASNARLLDQLAGVATGELEEIEVDE